MDSAIERPITWLHWKRVPETSLFVRRPVNAHGQTLRIYCVGDLGPDEMFMRLPELCLQKDSKTIKLEKKIRVVRMPMRIGRTIKSVYVKQHNALSLCHRLVSLFCASAALRSLSGATTLLQEGYATAQPIAAVEYRRRGILIKSFYLSEEIAGAKTIADYWCENLVSLNGIEGQLKRRAVLRALAHLLKSLHNSRIYHNDLKASNILALDRASTEEIFSVIDLQGMRKCFYLSERRRIKNLAQINRTLGNYLTRTQKLFFLKTYLGDEIHIRSRFLIPRIIDETRRQVTKGRSRQPTAGNYPVWRWHQRTSWDVSKFHALIRRCAFPLWVFFGFSGWGYAHSGIVDGYGCHRGTDKVSYHCHQGQFIGRTFKSKEDFLRQLRGGKSEQLSPKSNPPQLEKKSDQ